MATLHNPVVDLVGKDPKLRALVPAKEGVVVPRRRQEALDHREEHHLVPHEEIRDLDGKAPTRPPPFSPFHRFPAIQKDKSLIFASSLCELLYAIINTECSASPRSMKLRRSARWSVDRIANPKKSSGHYSVHSANKILLHLYV